MPSWLGIAPTFFMKETICPEGVPQPASRCLLSDHLSRLRCVPCERLALSLAVITIPAQIHRVRRRRVTLFHHDVGEARSVSGLCMARRPNSPAGRGFGGTGLSLRDMLAREMECVDELGKEEDQTTTRANET